MTSKPASEVPPGTPSADGRATPTNYKISRQEETPSSPRTPGLNSPLLNSPTPTKSVSSASLSNQKPDTPDTLLQGDPTTIALNLFHSSVPLEVLPPAGYAAWLGDAVPSRAAVCSAYMGLFDWQNVPLDVALRSLCSRLVLRGEAQQVERLIRSFSDSWWRSNCGTLFPTAGVVYAAAYSLIMLNGMLHSPAGSRISCEDYSRSTMAVVAQELELPLPVASAFEAQLRSFYDKLQDEPLPWPMEDQQHSHQVAQQETSKSPLAALLNASPLRKARKSRQNSKLGGVLTWKPRTASGKEAVTQNHNSGSSALKPATSEPSGICAALTECKISSDSNPPCQKAGTVQFLRVSVNSPWDAEAAKLYKQAEQNSGWRIARFVVSQGVITIFRTDEKYRRRQSGCGQSNGEAMEYSNVLARVDLQNTLAERFGASWFLNVPSGKSIYVVESANEAVAEEFVFTCNFWAAQRTLLPLRELCTNDFYGWYEGTERAEDVLNNCKDSERPRKSNGGHKELKELPARAESRKLVHWRPPELENGYPQIKSASDHMEALRVYIEEIQQDIEQHEFAGGTISRIFPDESAANYKKAVDNWKRKNRYLGYLLAKHQAYLYYLQLGFYWQEVTGELGSMKVSTVL